MIPGTPKDGDVVVHKGESKIVFLIFKGIDNKLYRKQILPEAGSVSVESDTSADYGNFYFLACNLYEVIERIVK